MSAEPTDAQQTQRKVMHAVLKTPKISTDILLLVLVFLTHQYGRVHWTLRDSGDCAPLPNFPRLVHKIFSVCQGASARGLLNCGCIYL